MGKNNQNIISAKVSVDNVSKNIVKQYLHKNPKKKRRDWSPTIHTSKTQEALLVPPGDGAMIVKTIPYLNAHIIWLLKP